jgi:hypothetical protein
MREAAMRLGSWILVFVFLSILAIGCDKTEGTGGSAGPDGTGKPFSPDKKGLPNPPKLPPAPPR